MARKQISLLTRMHQFWARALAWPPLLAFLPAISLIVFWFGGERALIMISALLPLIYLASGRMQKGFLHPRDAISGLLQRSAFEDLVEQTYLAVEAKGQNAAILCVILDEYDQVVERYGQSAADLVVRRVGERMISALRADDAIGQYDEAQFAICTSSVRQLDLELCIQLSLHPLAFATSNGHRDTPARHGSTRR